MGVDGTGKDSHEHHAVVTERDDSGNRRLGVFVPDDDMRRVDPKDHAGAGIARRRVREAASVGSEVVNPQVPRHAHAGGGHPSVADAGE